MNADLLQVLVCLAVVVDVWRGQEAASHGQIVAERVQMEQEDLALGYAQEQSHVVAALVSVRGTAANALGPDLLQAAEGLAAQLLAADQTDVGGQTRLGLGVHQAGA